MRHRGLAGIWAVLLCTAAFAGCSTPDEKSPATPPPDYEEYEAEWLGASFYQPTGAGVAEYPEYGRSGVFAPDNTWTIYLTRVDHTNAANVAPFFTYTFGMRPQDLLGQLQEFGSLGEISAEDIVFVESRSGEAAYVRLDPTVTGFNWVGAAGSPTRLIMVTGSTKTGGEEGLEEAFLITLRSIRIQENGEE